jgi:hypothetical protein
VVIIATHSPPYSLPLPTPTHSPTHFSALGPNCSPTPLSTPFLSYPPLSTPFHAIAHDRVCVYDAGYKKVLDDSGNPTLELEQVPKPNDKLLKAMSEADKESSKRKLTAAGMMEFGKEKKMVV